MGRGVFSGESQPIIVDVDNLIGVVDDPDEAAMIEGFFHSPCKPGLARAAEPMNRSVAL